jgi:DNA replication licensing factor MCM5
LGLSFLFNLNLRFIDDKDSSRRMDNFFTPEEEEQFKRMSQDPNIYEKIYKSVANAIYGHIDVKKAIACLLFSGSKKELRDKTRLRGYYNYLIIINKK